MDIYKLVPLIGVLVGWGLAQFAGVLSSAKDVRRLRSQSLPPFIDLYLQQFRLNKILEHFNYRLGDSIEELTDSFRASGLSKNERERFLSLLFSSFEMTRRNSVAMEDKEGEHFFESLNKATGLLAQVDPVDSYKLLRLTNEYRSFISLQFPPDKIDPLPYLKTHGSILSVFRSDLEELRELIHTVARRISWFEYFRLRSLLKQEEALMSEDRSALIEDVIASIRKTDPDSTQYNSSHDNTGQSATPSTSGDEGDERPKPESEISHQ